MFPEPVPKASAGLFPPGPLPAPVRSNQDVSRGPMRKPREMSADETNARDNGTMELTMSLPAAAEASASERASGDFVMFAMNDRFLGALFVLLRR